ncbi:unnamed protein product [Cochlearia groenlandica]
MKVTRICSPPTTLRCSISKSLVNLNEYVSPPSPKQVVVVVIDGCVLVTVQAVMSRSVEYFSVDIRDIKD